MASLWKRIPVWADWLVAAVAAVVVFNLNVTDAGDPLSGLGLSAGDTSPGITESARSSFYGVLVVGGLLVAATGLIISTRDRWWRAVGGLLTRTFSGVAVAGILGLLLDYRDGPVRTVHLFAYLMLALGIMRLARVAALASVDPAQPVDGDRADASQSSETRR
ncbi:MAG: hypothetical protein AAGA42_15240 [Actinomycetota bacterium]